ncbi:MULTISPECIES: cation:proton antiporter [unclassified Bradyrhizobium]|uniref:cation:proton antiporter domain-containing protein n=1 Tax=unclassified Bradyrhizobium TaxID=2631580 RepID=UPI0028E6FFE0|nr:MULTISPECIES: cation:proton antiporter [unclassified Bradyrhizobium]
MSQVALFLTQSLTLMVIPFAVWRLAGVRRVMPLAVVQILAGLLAGPTLFANLAPETFASIFPPSSVERLSGLCWLAAILFTSLTGMHLDLSEVGGKNRVFFAIGLSNMGMPLVLGICVGLWAVGNAPTLIGSSGNKLGFVFAIGIAASATALPVLGAILRDAGLIESKIGKLALSYAALNDVLLWLLITLLLSTVGSSSPQIAAVVWLIPSTLLYFSLSFLVVRPLLARYAATPNADGRITPGQIVLIICHFVVSALVTELIGLHYLIGAFTAGAIVPKPLKPLIAALFEPLCAFILLPFYFVATGLKVSLNVEVGQTLSLVVLSMIAATSGRIVGMAVPARLSGLAWRDAIHLGILLQSKGFVEVAILNVFFDAGLISQSAFSALILMAIVTTAMTMPAALAFESSSARTTPSGHVALREHAHDRD